MRKIERKCTNVELKRHIQREFREVKKKILQSGANEGLKSALFRITKMERKSKA